MDSSTDFDQIVIPEGINEPDPLSLYAVLAQVPDKRKRRGKRYEAALVLTLLLLAKLSGENRLSGIAQWARLRKEWVREHLPLDRDSLPCGNTYHNVCDQVSVDELNQRLADFFASGLAVEVSPTDPSTEELSVEDAVVEELPAKEVVPAPQVPRHWVLDGKTLRGSHRPSHGEAAQSALALYDLDNHCVLAQPELAGKGHERATALALVKKLNLGGVLLSADALHTQPAWCRCVREQGGDYLLIAKANQGTLRSDIALLFSEEPRPWLPEQSAKQVEQAHGRLEIRSLRTSCELNDYLSPKWPDVAQVFQLRRTTTRGNHSTTEIVYGLTSLTPQVAPPPKLLRFIREYWQIENRLHWRRDVTLGEDACLVSRGQVPQVLAALNNAILALVDWLGVTNLAAQRRTFAAHPDTALALLLQPL